MYKHIPGPCQQCKINVFYLSHMLDCLCYQIVDHMRYGIIEGTGETGNEQATGPTYLMKRGSSEDDTKTGITYITTIPLNVF